MDLASVIASFATGTYTVTRGTKSYSQGRAAAPVTFTFQVLACAQPLSGRELERLPEGMRGREVLKFYTETMLRTAEPGGVIPDTLVIDGRTWEVQTVERWNTLGNYYKVLLAKVGS